MKTYIWHLYVGYAEVCAVAVAASEQEAIALIERESPDFPSDLQRARDKGLDDHIPKVIDGPGATVINWEE